MLCRKNLDEIEKVNFTSKIKLAIHSLVPYNIHFRVNFYKFINRQF